MKRAAIFAAVPLIVATVLYLTVAFVVWEGDPAQWHTDTRGLLAWMTFVFSVAGIVVLVTLLPKRRDP